MAREETVSSMLAASWFANRPSEAGVNVMRVTV